MALKDKAKGMNTGAGIPFMEGRSKGEIKDLFTKTVLVTDYAFLKGEEGDYLVFVLFGDDEHFYFGSSVATEHFKEFTEEDKKEIQTDGLPVMFEERKSKKGRMYQAVVFYPED